MHIEASYGFFFMRTNWRSHEGAVEETPGDVFVGAFLLHFQAALPISRLLDVGSGTKRSGDDVQSPLPMLLEQNGPLGRTYARGAPALQPLCFLFLGRDVKSEDLALLRPFRFLPVELSDDSSCADSLCSIDLRSALARSSAIFSSSFCLISLLSDCVMSVVGLKMDQRCIRAYKICFQYPSRGFSVDGGVALTGSLFGLLDLGKVLLHPLQLRHNLVLRCIDSLQAKCGCKSVRNDRCAWNLVILQKSRDSME